VNKSTPYSLGPVTYDPHNDDIYANNGYGYTISNSSGNFLFQIFVMSAKTLSTITSVSFPWEGYQSDVWSVVYDAASNNIFISASDGPVDECLCWGNFVTISASTNRITSIVGNYPSQFVMPYLLEVDTSNNLVYAFDFNTQGTDVFSGSTGAYVTTLGANYNNDLTNCCGLAPANYALDGNLVSGVFIAAGCYNEYGVLNSAGGCDNWPSENYNLNGSFYSLSGSKVGSKITSLAKQTSTNCADPFWSGVSKLTYDECGSKLYIFNTSTGKLSTTLSVQGTIMVFNRQTDMLYMQSGSTIYEIGS